MRFNSVLYLLLILLLPLLHFLWKRRSQLPKVPFPADIPKNLGRSKTKRALVGLRYLALVFLILALARPQTSYRQTERTVSGVDIVMVLDVSASMNIEDLAERPRLDIAKETMERFIKARQNDRIGFVMFSGEPLTLAPPTLDYGLVLKALRDAAIGVLKDGTAIGDGLSLAISHLRNSKAKSRVIVLLTDGDNNVGQVDPITAGELAVGYGIRVYTIAIGREGRVKMPVRQRGVFGNSITTYQWFDNALNPQLLDEIAKKTGGKFYRVTDEGTLVSVFKEIDQLERSEIKTHEKIKYDDIFDKPLLISLLFLLAERIIALGLWRVLP